jgi:hypothetical protein
MVISLLLGIVFDRRARSAALPPRRQLRRAYLRRKRRRIGGELRRLDAGTAYFHAEMEPEHWLPADIVINECRFLPRVAQAILDHPTNSMARDAVLLQVDCNGVTPRDTPELRQFHEELKEAFLRAGWADPIGGGGIKPNEAGFRALERIAHEGYDGMEALFEELIDSELTPPTPESGFVHESRTTSGPTDAPNVRGRPERPFPTFSEERV